MADVRAVVMLISQSIGYNVVRMGGSDQREVDSGRDDLASNMMQFDRFLRRLGTTDFGRILALKISMKSASLPKG